MEGGTSVRGPTIFLDHLALLPPCNMIADNLYNSSFCAIKKPNKGDPSNPRWDEGVGLGVVLGGGGSGTDFPRNCLAHTPFEVL